MPSVFRRDEYHPLVESVRRPFYEFMVFVIDIGAAVTQPRVIIEINQHGEQLDENIGVGLQPESVGILAIFDAELTFGQIDAAFLFDSGNNAGVLKSLHEISTHLESFTVLPVEIDP